VTLSDDDGLIRVT